MVTSHPARNRGIVLVELVVALAILGSVVLTIAYATMLEIRSLRAAYNRAVAIGIVDGEIEILAAGGWKAWAEGEHDLDPDAAAAANLPPGRFVLTRSPGFVRVAWEPADAGRGGSVVREARIQ